VPTAVSATDPTAGPDRDDAVVAAFGYRPALLRRLTGWSSFGLAFSTISITSGIFINFQAGYAELGPAHVWTWPVAAGGQLLVALVVAGLARRVPLAGATYQWGRRLMGPAYGWFVGALGVMYVVVGLPGIALLAAAPLLQYALGIDGGGARLTLLIALAFLTVGFLANAVGTGIAARVNNVAVWCEIAGTAVVAAVLVVLLAGDSKPGGHSVTALTNATHPPGHPYWYATILAGLTGVYTLVGFESAADLAEETVHPERTVPRAVLSALGTSAGLGFLVLIVFTLAVPGNGALLAQGGLPAVFAYWLGDTAARLVIGVVVVAMFGLMVAGAAAGARLLFAMGRDGVLPGGLAVTTGERRIPLPALITGWLLSAGVLGYGYASGDAFGTLVAATALVPFVVYLLVIVAALRTDAGADRRPGQRVIAGLALVWVVAVVLALALPARSRDADYYVLGGLLIATLWWARLAATASSERRSRR
jgi:amino acid transporter